MDAKPQMHLFQMLLHTSITHTLMAWADPADGQLDGLEDYGYWQYIALSLSHTLFADAGSPDAALRAAGLAVGTLGGFYNAVAFVAAFAMVPLRIFMATGRSRNWSTTSA